eukprot:PhF_6_TR29383/c2_g1_i1/m.43322/K10396/KIF5; kinesin family member 5
MTDAAPPSDLNRIAVYLRVRPPTDEERSLITKKVFSHILSDVEKTPDAKKNVIVDQSGKQYSFDRVFRDQVTQKDIFEECALPSIQNLLDGYCGAVLAYGQTGTGKTHTMQGTREDRGIIYRCAELLFKRIKSDPNNNYEIEVNFVQIYLDRLQDMFRPDAPEININPDTERVELPGITSRKVRSTEDFIEAFFDGNKHRVVRATNMNATSSRGHAAFIVHMKCTPKVEDPNSGTKIGKLVLVDLAGYERFAQTGVEGGIAMEEAKKINHSLLALGSVVNALAAAAEKGEKGKKDHIPFRNAKLTRLLKDCLGGTSKTSIICTIGPLDKYKQETLGTLYFGFRAMAVKVNANVKTVFDPAKYLESLKQNLSTSQEVIWQMARWWNRTSPKDYQAYCTQYGQPTERDLNADAPQDDDDDVMLSPPPPPQRVLAPPQATQPAAPGLPQQQQPVAITATTSQQQPTPAAPNRDMAPTDVALAQAGAVRREWNQELTFLKQQAEQEEKQLRTHHMQEQQDAQARGITPEQMKRLLEAQAQEIEMMHMAAAEERQGLVAQREKEEVGVVLTTCVRSEELTGDVSGRVHYICDFLKNTCPTKNEVVANLISLVVQRERQISALEAAQALAAAQLANSGSGDAEAAFFAAQAAPPANNRQSEALQEEVLTLRFMVDDLNKELTEARQALSRSRSGSFRQATPAQQVAMASNIANTPPRPTNNSVTNNSMYQPVMMSTNPQGHNVSTPPSYRPPATNQVPSPSPHQPPHAPQQGGSGNGSFSSYLQIPNGARPTIQKSNGGNFTPR